MTQGELEKIPQPFVQHMNSLEERIMEDIVRRIKINGFSSASADWELSRTRQLGESEADIKQWIKEALKASDKDMDKIFSDTVYKEYTGKERAYHILEKKQLTFEKNQELQRLIKAVRKQTSEEYKNMTASLGFAQLSPSGKIRYSPIQEFYRNTLDAAMMDIHSGAFDYDTVLRRTIDTMTKSGVRWIDFDSGHRDRVDVAARRAVMTGFRQIQGKINEQVAHDLHTDSYEVTWHAGARPSHQMWQGRVWTMKQLVDVCGLGDVAGLHGANCYHDYNAFIPGVSVRTYTDEQLDQMNREENTPKIYNGKEYSTYEALQQQRKMERVMCKTRQDISLMKKGEADPEQIVLKKARYQGQMQTYKDFSSKMELPEQMKRVYQDGLNGKFTPGKREQEQISKIAAGKARYSKFSERFTEFNNGQKDVITIRRLLNNMNKTKIGQETVKYISEHSELNIGMCYNVDAAEGLLGFQEKDEIYIYASKTETVQKTAETLIHEITHHRYDIGGNQWSECVCRAQELKHRNGVDKLTGNELRDIIKSVRKDYPEYGWR